jgi:hypothetical protein
VRRWLCGDRYTLVAYAIFLILVPVRWQSVVGDHESLYLLGARRVADPAFLAADFTWSSLPPTSWLFDHLVAPLWLVLDEFAIANVGRVVAWWLTAWSLAALARSLRLPPWSAVAGFVAWMLWRQTFTYCGSPLEGFQVKSLSYPLVWFALAFAAEGRIVRAGAAAGLGTAFHVVVGGWGCLALWLSLLVNRRLVAWRELAAYLLAAAPFVGPLVLAIWAFHGAGASAAEQARMDEIYVRFAAPHCCDVDYYMSPKRWVVAAIVFAAAPLLAFSWPERRAARILGGFVSVLVLLFLAGLLAQRLQWYGLLKLFPGQLGASLPALVLFTLFFAFVAAGPAARPFGRWVWALVLVATLGLLDDRDAAETLSRAPADVVEELRRPEWGAPPRHASLYAWIRAETPRDSVFVTPFLADFWSSAERAQVATMRQPPLDRRLLEWKDRLEALNGFRPFRERGVEIEAELERNEGRLTIDELARIRERYGATHYLSPFRRPDLEDRLRHASGRYHVYELAGLSPPAEPSEPR